VKCNPNADRRTACPEERPALADNRVSAAATAIRHSFPPTSSSDIRRTACLLQAEHLPAGTLRLMAWRMAFRLADRQTECPRARVFDRSLFPVSVIFCEGKCGSLSADYSCYQTVTSLITGSHVLSRKSGPGPSDNFPRVIVMSDRIGLSRYRPGRFASCRRG
jgi:hypothetical protein